MEANATKISAALQEWKELSKGKFANFIIQIVVPVVISIGLSVYYSINVPSGKEWFNALAIWIIIVAIWAFFFLFLDRRYQKQNESALTKTIKDLLEEKDHKISKLQSASENLREQLESDLEDLQEKLVAEMARNGTLASVSNRRIRKIANYYEAGIHDPFNFINNVLNEKNDGGIENVIEALTSFYYEVRFQSEYGDIEVASSLRISLWVESNEKDMLEIIASKSYGDLAPTKKGCKINSNTEKSKLQSLAWNDLTPKAFSDAKKVEEVCRTSPYNAPFELDSGWRYKISSACCIPIECPETATKLGVLWVDTNIPNVFHGDSGYNLDENQWKDEIAPLFGPFLDRLAFYIWLKKCADAIDTSLKRGACKIFNETTNNGVRNEQNQEK